MNTEISCKPKPIDVVLRTYVINLVVILRKETGAKLSNRKLILELMDKLVKVNKRANEKDQK